MDQKIVIVAAARTALGSFSGSLALISAADLGAKVIQSLLERSNLKAEQIDEVIMGQVLTAGQGQNPARQASIKAGIPETTPAMTVNMVCGSGLKAINLATQAIMAGEAEIVVAGGQENMSQSAHILPNSRNGQKMGAWEMQDTMIVDGLWCAFNDCHMGVTAENIAGKYGFSREAQDQFAAQSQNRAEATQQKGLFKDEIVPITIPQRKGDPIVFDTDEFPRHGTTAESLGRLRPAFKKDGTVTAGNASGINDGAAAVVVMRAEKAAQLGLTPMARIAGFASAGVDPAIMGTGPIPSTQKCLERAGWKISDLDLIEANEAFAAQAMSVNQELGLDGDRVNTSGGAIALGHPIGASGARVLVTLIYGMKRENAQKGLATLCIGGGQGVAMAIEKL